jgi:hypothetical protein
MIILAFRTAPGFVAEERRQRPLATCRKRLAYQDPRRAGQTRQPILEACFWRRPCAERGLEAVSIAIPLIVAGVLVMRYKV